MAADELGEQCQKAAQKGTLTNFTKGLCKPDLIISYGREEGWCISTAFFKENGKARNFILILMGVISFVRRVNVHELFDKLVRVFQPGHMRVRQKYNQSIPYILSNVAL